MTNPFKKLKDQVIDYIKLRYTYIKLELIERVVMLVSYLSFLLIAVFVLFLVLLFAGFGIAAVFETLFNGNTIASYFATAGVFIVFVIIMLLARKIIIRFFASSFLSIITASKKKPEDSEKDV